MSKYYENLLRGHGWPEESIDLYKRFPSSPICRLYPLVQDRFTENKQIVRPKHRVKAVVKGKEVSGILLSALTGATRMVTDHEIRRAANAKSLERQRPGEGTLPGTTDVDWWDVRPEDGKRTPVV